MALFFTRFEIISLFFDNNSRYKEHESNKNHIRSTYVSVSRIHSQPLKRWL